MQEKIPFDCIIQNLNHKIRPELASAIRSHLFLDAAPGVQHWLHSFCRCPYSLTQRGRSREQVVQLAAFSNEGFAEPDSALLRWKIGRRTLVPEVVTNWDKISKSKAWWIMENKSTNRHLANSRTL